MERLQDVWTERDFPVLVEIARRIDENQHVSNENLMDATGFDSATVSRAAQALQRRGLVSIMWFGDAEFMVKDVTGSVYTLTGLHPSGDDAVSRLVEALRQAADQVDDADERSRLRKAADGLLGVSRDVLGGVLVNLATKGMFG